MNPYIPNISHLEEHVGAHVEGEGAGVLEALHPRVEDP